MADNEKKLLVALVRMVEQHLWAYDDEIDSLAESAGEHAIEALADCGLMELVNTRFGRWTEIGQRFRRDEAGIPPVTDGEQKVLVALVLMVNQYLNNSHGVEVDSRSLSAGEHAIDALAAFGLMEVVDTRFGRWTEAGKRFRRAEAGIRDPEPIDYRGQIRLVGSSEPES